MCGWVATCWPCPLDRQMTLYTVLSSVSSVSSVSPVQPVSPVSPVSPVCLVAWFAWLLLWSCVLVFVCSSRVLLVFLRSLCSCARVFFVCSRVVVFLCSRVRVFVCLCVLVLLCCCVLVFFCACLLAVCRLLLPLLPSALFSPLPPWLGPGIFARGGIKRLQIPSFFEDRSNKNKGVSFVFLRATKTKYLLFFLPLSLSLSLSRPPPPRSIVRPGFSAPAALIRLPTSTPLHQTYFLTAGLHSESELKQPSPKNSQPLAVLPLDRTSCLLVLAFFLLSLLLRFLPGLSVLIKMAMGAPST